MLERFPTYRRGGGSATSLIKSPAVFGLALIATALAVALMIGGVGSLFGVKGLLLLPMAGMAVLILVRPIIGLFLLAILIPVENLVVLDLAGMGAATGAKAVGALVFLGWGLNKLTARSSWSTIFSARILKPAIFFVLLAFASLLWGGVSDHAIARIITLAQLLLFSLVVLDIIISRGSAEWLVRCLMVGGLVALLLTIQQVIVDPSVRRAGDEISGGINRTALTLVILTPLAFVLLRSSGSLLWRLLGLVYIALAPLGVSLTLSRTSMVMMPVALGSQLWELAKGGLRNLVLILIGLIIVGVVLFATVDWESVLARGSTISTAMQGERRSDGKLDSSRMQHWLAGLMMLRDHPIVGVGIGNFGIYFNEYQFLVPEAYVASFATNERRSPHSSLFGILAELGLIGGALWMWLIIIALLNARRSWTMSKVANNQWLEVLSQGVFYSLLIYALYSPFSMVHTDKILWLLFGLSEVSRRLALSQVETTVDYSKEVLATAGTSIGPRTSQT